MYKKHGDKNILVLHGGPGAIGGCHKLAKSLEAVEVLNYGQTIQDQLEEINTIIQELNYKEVIVVGHSWGAWLAYLYACKYKVAKIILIGCGAFKSSYLGSMQEKRKGNLCEEENNKLNHYFKLLSSGQDLNDDGEFDDLVTKMDSYASVGSESIIEFDHKGHQHLMAEFNALRSSGEILEMGKTITAEVVVIHGEDDPHPYLGVVEPFDEIELDYTLKLLSKCGHTPWLEQYAQVEFNQLMDQHTRYIVESDRLGFRKMRQIDLDHFVKMNASKEVMKYFPNILTEEESRLFLERIIKGHEENGFGLYAVEVKSCQEWIGFIGLSKPTFEADFMPCVEIGWRLDHKYWHQGFATEGAKAVLSYGFNVLDLKEIVSFTADINAPSIKVMKKIGMTYVKSFDHPKVLDTPLMKHVLYLTSSVKH